MIVFRSGLTRKIKEVVAHITLMTMKLIVLQEFRKNGE